MRPSHRLPAAVAGLMVAVAAAAAESPTPPGVDALTRSGWTPVLAPAATGAPAATAAPASVSSPTLPFVPGIVLLQSNPMAFPLPVITWNGGEAPAPLAATFTTVVAEGEGLARTLGWVPRLSATDIGAGLVELRVDVPPWEDDAPDPAAPAGRSGTLRMDAPGGVAMSRDQRQWRRDPARLPSIAGAESDHDLDLIRPELVATTAEHLQEDARVFRGGSGTAWIALTLEQGSLPAHALETSRVFGLSYQGRAQLVVAPRPRRVLSTLQLLAVDAASLGVRDLGSPRIDIAAWGQEVADVRVTADGGLEVAVLVHDTAPGDERSDSWGAVLASSGDGAWHERVRFALPGAQAALSVRFDPAAPKDLELLWLGRPAGRATVLP